MPHLGAVVCSLYSIYCENPAPFKNNEKVRRLLSRWRPEWSSPAASQVPRVPSGNQGSTDAGLSTVMPPTASQTTKVGAKRGPRITSRGHKDHLLGKERPLESHLKTWDPKHATSQGPLPSASWGRLFTYTGWGFLDPARDEPAGWGWTTSSRPSRPKAGETPRSPTSQSV